MIETARMFIARTEALSEASRIRELEDRDAAIRADQARREVEALRQSNGARPCDCISCDCHNTGDAQAVASWDAIEAAASAIERRIGIGKEKGDGRQE